tara:strand:+ start:722 stop:1555 length:834 start_codon:yes stop_codon:yes gene_type:complete
MKEIGIFYLLRKKNDRSYFFKFIDSYKEFEAGQDHDLLIILKGFKKNDDIKWIADSLRDIDFNVIFYPDKGFDISAYFYASRKVKYEHVMFINSFSSITSKNWLNKIFKYIDNEVIAVGCSGSFESISSSFYYNKIYANKNILKKAINVFFYPFVLLFFQKFPSSHIRTNAFLINRKFFLGYNFKIPHKLKIQAWFFENGRTSLSKFITRKGKNYGLVNKDGNFYSELKFNESKTFADLNENNALITDNQISNFSKLNTEQKKIKSLLNWDLNKLYN